MRRHRHQIVIRRRRQIGDAVRRLAVPQQRIHRRRPLRQKPPLQFRQIPLRLAVHRRDIFLIRRHGPHRLRRPDGHRPIILLGRRG